jgi:WD40 repeat protein
MKTKYRISLPHIIVIALLVLIAFLLIVLARSLFPIGITRQSIAQVEEVARLGDGRIAKAVWSPDGKRIALAGTVGVRIIEVDDLDAPGLWLEEHEGFVGDVAFSQQGNLLAYGSEDGIIRMLDTQTWQLIAMLEGHEGQIENVVFSPDGRTLVSTDRGETPSIRLWNVEKRKEIAVMTQLSDIGSIEALTISPDSRLLVTKTSFEMHVWRLADGKDLGIPRAHNLSSRDSVTFSADGQWLIFGASRLRFPPEGVWHIDGQSYEPVSVTDPNAEPPFKLDEAAAAYLASDPGILQALEAFPVDMVRIWGQINQRSRSGDWRDEVVVADPTGQMLLVTWRDRVELWDAAGPTLKAVLHRNVDSFRNVAVSPDGDLIGVTSGYQVHMWDMAQGASHTQVDLHPAGGHLESFIWLQESFQGLLIDNRGGARWLDLPTSSTLYNVEYAHEPIFSPDHRYMATPGMNRTVAIYNTYTGQMVSSFVPIPTDRQVTYAPLAFSLDGSILAIRVQGRACECSVISLWDTATGEHIKELGESGSLAKQAAFTSDGTKLIVGSSQRIDESTSNGLVQVWDVETGVLLKQLEGARLSIHQIEFSPDNRYVVVRDPYGDIWMWDLTPGADNGARFALEGEWNQERYSVVRFNPQGDLLFIGAAWGDIVVYDVATGELVRTLKGHKRQVADLRFVDEGRMLLSTGSDGTVRIWAAAGTTPISGTPVEQPVVPTIALTPTIAGR